MQQISEQPEIENLLLTCKRLIDPEDLGYQVEPEARRAVFDALNIYYQSKKYDEQACFVVGCISPEEEKGR